MRLFAKTNKYFPVKFKSDIRVAKPKPYKKTGFGVQLGDYYDHPSLYRSLNTATVQQMLIEEDKANLGRIWD